MALTKLEKEKMGESYMCETEVELPRYILHEGSRKKTTTFEHKRKREMGKKMNET